MQSQENEDADRYVGRETVDGMVVYDRENLNAWIESDTTRPVEDAATGDPLEDGGLGDGSAGPGLRDD
ncbi:hypothetical protein G9C85_11040 [Halorubellus sp. JP-L1]|uniref:DUF7331 family protein n=1 Tax=Halorubellus sp. JP-L1 TaxID=2715753 RepID=UPI001407FD77|nr:hypothetical protein [Halorubellus sp. JP-L1]NHN42158.1 hypothetical protein [Halorubellus sp. JP-L1]